MRRWSCLSTVFFLLLGSGLHEPAAPADNESAEIHKLALPGMRWAAAVSIPAFELEGERTKPDGSQASMHATNVANGVLLALYLEREPAPLDSAGCRSKYFTRALESGLKKSRIKRWEEGNLALGQYLLAEPDGVPMNQMNVDAYLSKDAVCIDLHLSKVQFKESDRKHFDAVIRSLRIVEGE